jgi:hypothetical protein
MTNKNYFKKFFFFSFRYLWGGDEIIAPQMGSCDEISRIWSFKNYKNTYKKWKVTIALQKTKSSWTLS